MGQILLQAYCTARLADLPPLVMRELDPWPSVRLLLCPSTKALTAPTWQRLEHFAAAGGTVYVSFFAGSTTAQRGPWWPDLDQRFGVHHQLRYGLVEPVEDDEIVLTFERPFGHLRAGTILRVRVAGNEHGRAFLPVEPTEATVIARDQRGRPALLTKHVGSGQLLLMTYPLEYFAATRPHANPDEGTIALYSALAQEAAATPPVGIHAPDVWCDRLVRDDGTVFLWIVSERETTAVVTLETAEGTELLHLTTSEPLLQPLELPPYGVAVLRLVQ